MVQLIDVKWPPEYNELTIIEDLLHCRICYEYIETCVVTPCSHNYCSICIRKFLHYKTQCPMCFENIYEKDLHANRVIDELMESYSSLREKLISCIKGARVKEPDITDEKKLDFQSITPAKCNKSAKNVKSLTETPRKLFGVESASGSKSFDDFTESQIRKNQTPIKCVSSASTSDKTPKRNDILTSKSEEHVKTEINKKRVPCPVCSIEISETNINKHLDDCLKRQKSMSPILKDTAKVGLKPLPKYVLNLMKDTQLRQVLKKYGLSTSGVRKILEKRLQRFSIFYNAERDKRDPKSVEELVKLCEVEESVEKNIMKQNSTDSTLNINRKTDSTAIEKARKQYLENNKDEYQKLVKSINERERGKITSNRPFLRVKSEEEIMATTSSASRSSILNQSDENNETRSSIADSSYYHLHDTSNSTNASYPLQHYSHDDPMRHLALVVSSDTENSPIKLKGGSSSRNEIPTDSRIKLEPSQQSNDIFSSSDSTSFEETEEKKIDDIYDLSTEDNRSDSCLSKDSKKTKEKKHFMKRTKVDATRDNYRSSDSETDVETNFRSFARKTAKKKNAKGNGKENFDERVDDEDTDNDFEPVSNLSESSPKESKEDKENLKVENVGDDGTTITNRRSARKRNHVPNYATSSKRAKVIENAGAKNNDDVTLDKKSKNARRKRRPK